MDQRMLTEQMNYENFLAKVIKWVCIGVAITAITSFIVILSGIIRIIASFYLPILFISVIVELLFVWRIAKKLEDSGNEVSYSSAKKYFILYSMMNGVVFSFVYYQCINLCNCISICINLCLFWIIIYHY